MVKLKKEVFIQRIKTKGHTKKKMCDSEMFEKKKVIKSPYDCDDYIISMTWIGSITTILSGELSFSAKTDDSPMELTVNGRKGIRDLRHLRIDNSIPMSQLYSKDLHF